VRAKKHEILVAYDVQFIVIIIQRWTPAVDRAEKA